MGISWEKTEAHISSNTITTQAIAIASIEAPNTQSRFSSLGLHTPSWSAQDVAEFWMQVQEAGGRTESWLDAIQLDKILLKAGLGNK